MEQKEKTCYSQLQKAVRTLYRKGAERSPENYPRIIPEGSLIIYFPGKENKEAGTWQQEFVILLYPDFPDRNFLSAWLKDRPHNYDTKYLRSQGMRYYLCEEGKATRITVREGREWISDYEKAMTRRYEEWKGTGRPIEGVRIVRRKIGRRTEVVCHLPTGVDGKFFGRWKERNEDFISELLKSL